MSQFGPERVDEPTVLLIGHVRVVEVGALVGVGRPPIFRAAGHPCDMRLPREHRQQRHGGAHRRLLEAPAHEAVEHPDGEQRDARRSQQIRDRGEPPGGDAVPGPVAAAQAEQEQHRDQRERDLRIERVGRVQERIEGEARARRGHERQRGPEERPQHEVRGQQVRAREHEVAEPETGADDHVVGRAERPLVERDQGRQERWILHRLDRTGLVEQAVTLALRERGAEHEIGARIPPQVYGAVHPGNPHGHPEEHQGADADCVPPALRPAQHVILHRALHP